MNRNRLQIGDLDPSILADAAHRQELVDDFNTMLQEHEDATASAKANGRMFAIGGAIIALLIATGLAFLIPGPQGPQGLQGEKGDEGSQGPAITNEQLQTAVNAAIGARINEFPKALTAKEIRELVPPTPAYNDSGLKAETEALRKELGEVRKELAEVEKTKAAPVPVSSTNVSTTDKNVTGAPTPAAYLEETTSTEKINLSDVRWLNIGSYYLPTRKLGGRDRGLTSPNEPTIPKPRGWEQARWVVINGQDWALVK